MTATLTPFTRESTYTIADGGMLDLHYQDGQVSLERWPTDGSRPIVLDRSEAEELAKDILADSEWLSEQLGAACEEGEEIGKHAGYEEGYTKARGDAIEWAESVLEAIGDEDNLAASVNFRSALKRFIRREQAA